MKNILKQLLAILFLLNLTLHGAFAHSGHDHLPALGQSISVTPGSGEGTPTPTPTPDDSQAKLDDVKKRIKELEGQISGLQSKEKTLQSQIDVIDNQIALTELRIRSTQNEIDSISKDIDVASKKIKNLEGSLDKISKILLNRIVATYKLGNIPTAQLIASSESFTEYFERASYIKLAQANDKRILYDTQQARNDYTNQKNIFETQKKKIELLKGQLESYNSQIATEKKSKEDLLKVTKNDESKYQQLLAAAQAERATIEGVISSIKLENGTPISRGQVIAQVGNSGAPYCSTGPHLHFEVRVNGGDVNPAGYLKSSANWAYNYGSEQIDYYGAVNPSGDWDWPLDETIKINQGYGSHGFAKSFYSDGIHHGIDMVSDSSSLIKAPKDGTLYKGSASCNGVSMNYVAIDHGGGIVSWYWHVR